MAKRGKKAVSDKRTVAAGGINIYHDDKNRQVYLNRINHIGYVIDGQDKLFRTYSSRFFIGIVAAVIANMFDIPVIYSVLIGVIAYFLMEIKFRKFLNTLPQIPNFVPEKRDSTVVAESNLATNKIVLKIILFLALAVLLVINADMQKYTGAMLYLNWLLAVFALVMASTEIRAFLVKKNRG